MVNLQTLQLMNLHVSSSLSSWKRLPKNLPPYFFLWIICSIVYMV